MAKLSSNCDMCGRAEQLVIALIEGVEMSVCRNCASFGQILQMPKSFSLKNSFARQKPQEPQIVEQIVEEYALKIKQAREKRKLNQEEFAKMLNEKESVLHNIEAGKQKPSMELAKKLEKNLGISLIEIIEPDELSPNISQERRPKGPMTIGDMLLLKK